jgi:aspartate kinase
VTTRPDARPRLVMKFGGASLGDPRRVVEAVRAERARGGPLVLVVSAREAVTDRLLNGVRRPTDAATHRRVVAELRRDHPGVPGAGERHLERLTALFARLENGRRADGPLVDRILSQGERLAAHWVAGELRRGGVPAIAVEADHLGLMTDNAYGASCIVLDRSRAPVRRGLGRLLARGKVPVVTGFFGRSLEGRVATLGRGGSDYAATAIAALLGAPRVELVKRHVAVLSADPRDVPRARAIPELSYEEAEELAQFGAKVLHPLTIEPARAHGITITVRSLERPQLATTIGPARADRRNRAITALRPLRLFRLRVPGGRQRPGVVAEVAERLRVARVNVVQLFTSSALLCLVVEPTGAARAVRALRPITAEDAAVLDGPVPVALVTVIGDGVLDDLDRLPARAVAGAQGFSATPRALSLAVPERRSREVVRALHTALAGRGG